MNNIQLIIELIIEYGVFNRNILCIKLIEDSRRININSFMILFPAKHVRGTPSLLSERSNGLRYIFHPFIHSFFIAALLKSIRALYNFDRTASKSSVKILLLISTFSPRQCIQFPLHLRDRDVRPAPACRNTI